jgi:uncharacterized protein with NAD-binding domain and iron-sulfur cluster
LFCAVQEQHGSKMAFLDGAPPERLCQPLVDYFTAKGGELHMNARLKSIELNADGSVKQLQMVNGDTVSLGQHHVWWCHAAYPDPVAVSTLTGKTAQGHVHTLCC